MSHTGHCLCGATRWSFDGEISWACYCHCDDCRRNCAAPVVAWLGVPLKNFAWTGRDPKTYQSSEGVRRFFCDICGSPMGFEADHYPGGMHLYAASLAQPEQFAPAFHVNVDHKLSWLSLEDDLPRHDGTLLRSSAASVEYD